MESSTLAGSLDLVLSRANLESTPSYHELQISHYFEELGKIQGDDKCTMSGLFLE